MIKIKNKINLSVFILLSLIIIPYASASTSCNLNVTLVNQDPYPAIPGEYVDVVFQVSGLENSDCSGAMFNLTLSYPFSLDEGNSLQTIEGSTYVYNYKKDWMIPYKLRVDADAIDGENTVIVEYGEDLLAYTEYFNISVQDSRTTFDAVIQESTSSEVSIAIANTGKYVANSVVVRIPEQERFEVTGTDGQMIGNLDSGDYTIVGFSLTSSMQRDFQQTDENTKPDFQNQEKNLKFDIYYTDALGERRVVNMELPLQMTSTPVIKDEEIPEGFPMRNAQNNSSNIMYAVIILVVIGIIFFLYKKYPKKTKKIWNGLKQKFKGIFHRKKQSDYSHTIPDWMKNAKDKKK